MKTNTFLLLAIASISMETLAEQNPSTQIDVRQKDVVDVRQSDSNGDGSLETARQYIGSAYSRAAYEGSGRILYPIDSDISDPNITIIKLKNVRFSIDSEYTPDFSNGNRRVYAHFPSAPTQTQNKNLQAAGIDLNHYVTANTWIVSLNEGTAAKLKDIDKQVLFAEIAAADRSSPSLVSGLIPSYAFKDAKIHLQATLYKNARFTLAREQLASTGAENIAFEYSSISFSIAPELIPALVTLDFIAYLDFISPPEETNNANAANLSGIRRLGADVSNLTDAQGNPLYGFGINIGQWEPDTADNSHPDFQLPGGDNKITYGPTFEAADDTDSRLNIFNPGSTNVCPDCSHATHVAGTLVSGELNEDGTLSPDANLATAGMAPAAHLITSNSSNVLLEMNVAALLPTERAEFVRNDERFTAAAENALAEIQTPQILISTHSWGRPTGWGPCNEECLSSLTPAERESVVDGWRDLGNSQQFGEYSSEVKSWDDTVNTHKNLVITKSAGNERNDGPDLDSEAENPRRDGPFDSISFAGVAKNVITVGAVDGDGRSAIFSSWGPTNDGRIKPDVVALGVNVNSTAPFDGPTDSGGDGLLGGYSTKSGTSMAAPVVAGGIAVLEESWKRAFADTTPAASMIKALVINTARGLNEDGSEQNPNEYLGPNYKTGWGLFDAETANDTILQGASRFQGLTIQQGTPLNTPEQTFSLEIPNDFDGPIKITAAWTEPGSDPSVGGPALLNDIDIVLVDPQGNRHQPWVMPFVTERDNDSLNANDFGDLAGRPAIQGDNNTDNVEQVYVSNPQPGRWTLQVMAGQSFISDQEISIASNVDLTLTPQFISLAPGVKTPLDISTSISLGLLVDSQPRNWTPRFIAFGFDSVDGLPLDGIRVEDADGNIRDLSGFWTQFNLNFNPEGMRLTIPEPQADRKIRVEWWYTN